MCEVCASHCHHYTSWFHRQRGVWSVRACYQYMTHCTKAPFGDAHCCKVLYHYSHIKHDSLMPENSAMLQPFLSFHNWCKLLCMVFEMQSYTMHTTLYITTDLSLSNRPPETSFLTHIWILLQSIFYVMPRKHRNGVCNYYNMAPSIWVRQHTSSGGFSIRVVSVDIDSTEVIRIKSLGVCAQPS